ncbi:hypothetical protein CYMTET_14833 [Cymbomonas tetramitiformis]|uniref:Transmembrane protein 107 n=1 Tax=Cymbomonas tetramitiformis TaxID=36881 RepID=A0AAE0GFT8_9CHLO|nr:hypothetical protein CYMTET_14833 [Cymbomonas tetramitiformis]
MGAESITLPARFLATVAHLVVTLTILYDTDNITRRALEETSGYGDEKDSLQAQATTSTVCFVLEFVGMFSGVSLFFPTLNSFYIFLHINGTLYVGLFIGLHWGLKWYTWFFLLFSLLPALIEMLVCFAVFKLKMREYS